MNPGRPRLAATATTLALAISLTACNSTPEAKSTPTPTPTPPTLAEATRVLATDGQAIADDLKRKPDEIDDRTGVNDPKGCPAGTARRRYTLPKELPITESIHEDLAGYSAFLDKRVRSRGYKRVKYQNRQDQDGRDIYISVWRKAAAGVTFTVSVWAKDWNTRRGVIAGRTDCLR